MSAAQCARDGRQFSSVRAFDKAHSLGDGSFGSVMCHEPASRGLVLNGKGLWAWPPGRPVPPQGDENAGLTSPALGDVRVQDSAPQFYGASLFAVAVAVIEWVTSRIVVREAGIL